MSASMQSLGIDKMSPEDRLRLVQEIWDSLSTEAEHAPLTAEHKKEIDRRLASHRANPEAAVPWEQVEAEAVARLGE
jgi:putative addiction module component (TIGR02574 family)